MLILDTSVNSDAIVRHTFASISQQFIVEQKRKSGITEQLKRLASLLPDKCTCEAHGFSHLYVLEKAHDLLQILTVKNRDLKSKCINVSVEECETQVKNLEAKLNTLKKENERLKHQINEVEKKVLDRDHSSMNSNLPEQATQTERESIHNAASAVCDTLHYVQEGQTKLTSTSSSQFMSVAALLSSHTRNTCTQQMSHCSGVSLSQVQAQPALSQVTSQRVSTAEAMTSQTEVMTSRTGVMTSQTDVSSHIAVMTSQAGVSTSTSEAMASQTGVMTSQVGLMTPHTRIMTSHTGVVTSQTGPMMLQRGVMTPQNIHIMSQALPSSSTTLPWARTKASTSNQNNTSQLTMLLSQPTHPGNTTIERRTTSRQYRLPSDCSIDSVSEPFTSLLPPRSNHTTSQHPSHLSTSQHTSHVRNPPSDVQYCSPTQSRNNRFTSPLNCASLPVASNISSSRYTSGQHITSSRDQAASYARDCMVMPQCEDDNSQQIRHPEISRFFPRCQEADRLETDSSVSLYLPDSTCHVQRNASLHENPRRETSFSVLSLTGQSREQRSLSLPGHETTDQLHHHVPVHETCRSYNLQNSRVTSFPQWQEAPTVSYSPLKHVKPHEKFEGNFSINAIQGNRNMTSHPQQTSQFSIERLTSRQFEHNRVPSQSRFDIQSVMSRDEHVTSRVAPDQWDNCLSYAVTTRLLSNDHHQEGSMPSFLTHFNGQNAEQSARVPMRVREQNASYSSLSNCQWQQPPVANSTALSQSSFSSGVTCRTSHGQQVGWQVSSYNGY